MLEVTTQWRQNNHIICIEERRDSETQLGWQWQTILVELMSSVESVSQTSRSSNAVFTTVVPHWTGSVSSWRCGGVCPTSLHVFCILAWFSLQIQVEIKHKRRHLTASYGGSVLWEYGETGEEMSPSPVPQSLLWWCVCCVFQLGFYHPREGIWEGKPTPSHWKGMALMLVHKRMGMINGRVLNTEKTTSKGLKPRVWRQDQRHKQLKQRSKG